MLCLKCGNEMKDNEQICSKCGYNKNTVQNTDNPFGVKNQGIYNPNAVDKEVAQERLDHEKEFYDLAEIYMRPMYYNFKKGSFSWCAFFLSALYIAYRKMIAVSILVCILNVAIVFIFKHNAILLLSISLVFNIFLGLSFKKIYYEDSMEKVGQIRKSNPDKGFNQLAEIVKQKGGTNILYPIILLLIIAVIFTILYLVFGFEMPQVKLPFKIPNFN